MSFFSLLNLLVVTFTLWGAVFCPPRLLAQSPPRTLHIDGLKEPVEILIDLWGIAHIYAKNQHDLFFAQGYNAACDRLFQLEIWRRRVTGTS